MDNLRILLLSAIAAFAVAGCRGQPSAEFLRQYDWADRGEWLKVDTHIHTKFSDGEHQPVEIAAKAVEYGCEAIAITDHADSNLQAATPEYFEAIEVARRQFPQLIILAGLEWNVPPDGGDTHAVLLAPPGADEEILLRTFQQEFDDLTVDRADTAKPLIHTAERMQNALRFLDQRTTADGIQPLLLFEHVGRKAGASAGSLELLQLARRTSDLVIGFSGAPGHQADSVLGSYRGPVQPVDRWDPAVAEVGGAWDRVLQSGIDVWGAGAPSDFHNRKLDYWPGQFSETWVRVPERSPSGVLAGLRAGTYYGQHGRIVRDVDFSVDIAGLGRPARPGEAASAPTGSTLSPAVTLEIPEKTFDGEPNHIDSLELIEIADGRAELIERLTPSGSGKWTFRSRRLGAGDHVYRLRGRRTDGQQPDLVFVTNPIRIVSQTASWTSPSTSVEHWARGVRLNWKSLAAGLLCLLLLASVLSPWLSRTARFGMARRPDAGLQSSTGRFASSAVCLEDRWLLADTWRRQHRSLLVICYLVAVAVFGVWKLLTLHDDAAPGQFDPGLLVRSDVSRADVNDALPVVGLLLACLALVPWRPWIALAATWGLTYCWPRFSPAFELLMMARLPEQCAVLSAFGGLLFGRFSSTQLARVLRDPAAWCFAGWVVIATASATRAWWQGQPWTPDPHHHIGRIWLLCLLALTVMSYEWSPAALRNLWLSFIVVMTFRYFQKPELVGDHDFAWLAAVAATWCLASACGPGTLARRISVFCASGILSYLVIVTANRGAALGLLCGMLSLIGFRRRFNLAFVCLLAAIGVAAALASRTELMQRVAQTHPGGTTWNTVEQRFEIWQEAWRLSADAPWLGRGPGNSPLSVETDGRTGRRKTTHSTPIAVLLEVGWLGLIAWSGMLGFGLWRIFLVGRQDEPGIRWTAAGLVGACVSWFVSGLFQTRHDETLPLSLLLVGVCWGLQRSGSQTRGTADGVESSEKKILRNASAAAGAKVRLQRAGGRQSVGVDRVQAGTRLSALRVRRAAAGLAMLCALGIVYGSFVPLKFAPTTLAAAWNELVVRWSAPVGVTRIDAALNVMLTLPFALSALMATGSAHRLRPWQVAVRIAAVLIGGACLGFAVELGQFWFPPRVPSPRDIIAQVAGAACGAALWLKLGRSLTIFFEQAFRHRSWSRRRDWLLQAYVVAVVGYGLFPFDFVVNPAELRARLQDSTSVEWIPFSRGYASPLEAAYLLGTSIIVAIPLGWWSAVAWLRKEQTYRSVLTAWSLGASVLTAVEAAQVAIASRVASTTSLLAGCLGVLVGISTAAAFRRSAALRGGPVGWGHRSELWLAMAALWSGGLLVLNWAPLDVIRSPEVVQQRIQEFIGLPFARMQRGSDIGAMFHILRTILWWLPLGGALGVCSHLSLHRRRGGILMLSLAWILLLAAVAECGQIYLANRIADSTDILLNLTGGLIGLFGARWLAARTGPSSGVLPASVPPVAWLQWGFASVALGLVLVAIYASFLPFDFRPVRLESAWYRLSNSLGPDRQFQRSDVLLNGLIAVLLALSGLSAVGRPGRLTAFSRFLAACLVVAGCAALAITLEFCQAWLPSRNPSLLDCLAQTVGAVVGAGLWLSAGDRLQQVLQDSMSERRLERPTDWALQLYVVVFLAWNWFPLDIALSPGDLLTKIREGRLELIPFSAFAPERAMSLVSALEVFLSATPIGLWAAIAWRADPRRVRDWNWSLLIGGGVVTLATLGQVAVLTGSTSTTAWGLALAGVALGAFLPQFVGADWSQRPLPPTRQERFRSADLWMIAAIAWSGLIAVVRWYPFESVADDPLLSARFRGLFALPASIPFSNAGGISAWSLLLHGVLFAPLGVALAGVCSGNRAPPHRRLLATGSAGVWMIGWAVFLEISSCVLRQTSGQLIFAVCASCGAVLGFVTTAIVQTRSAARLPDDSNRPAEMSAAKAERRSPSPQLQALDGLRAIACLAVFGVHWQQITGVSGRWGPFDLQLGLENGHTGVALFFILSGFLLALPLWWNAADVRVPLTLRGFALKRAVRILPPYYLCLTTLLLVRAIAERLPGWRDCLLHYLLVHNYSRTSFYSISPPFWTIAVQVQFYVAFAVVVWLLSRRPSVSDRGLAAAFGGLTLLCYGAHVLLMNWAVRLGELPSPVLSHSVAAHLPLFWLGCLAAGVWRRGGACRSRDERLQPRWDAVFGLSAVAILAILTTDLSHVFQWPYGRYHFPFVPAGLALMIVAAPLSGISKRALEFWPLRWIGRISFGVYVYHLPCLNAVATVLNRFEWHPAGNAIVFGVMGLTLSLLVAGLSYRWIERPLLMWSHGRRDLSS